MSCHGMVVFLLTMPKVVSSTTTASLLRRGASDVVEVVAPSTLWAVWNLAIVNMWMMTRAKMHNVMNVRRRRNLDSLVVFKADAVSSVSGLTLGSDMNRGVQPRCHREGGRRLSKQRGRRRRKSSRWFIIFKTVFHNFHYLLLLVIKVIKRG